MVELHSHLVSQSVRPSVRRRRLSRAARSSVFKAVRLRANKNPNDATAAARRRGGVCVIGMGSLHSLIPPSLSLIIAPEIKFRLHGKAAIKRKLWLQTLAQRNVQSYFVRYILMKSDPMSHKLT